MASLGHFLAQSPQPIHPAPHTLRTSGPFSVFLQLTVGFAIVPYFDDILGTFLGAKAAAHTKLLANGGNTVCYFNGPFGAYLNAIAVADTAEGAVSAAREYLFAARQVLTPL